MLDYASYLKGAVLPAKKNLTQVFLGALGAVGQHFTASTEFLAQAQQAQKLLSFPDVKRVCVVLVDGLGSMQLLARRGHVPNLRALNLEEKITTVVPATTAAAVSALGTGLFPGQSAMAGYALRAPRTKEVFSLIKWDCAGYDAPQWQTHPTLFERLSEVDRQDTAVVQPREYIGSGLSLAALRGAPAYAAQTLAQRFATATHLLENGRKAVYVYWGDLDKAGHKYGWQSQQWTAELENLDCEFGRFLKNVPKGTLVILTADHGMVDAGQKIDFATEPAIAAEISQIAGEERAVQLYTQNPAVLAKRLREKYADLAWVLTKNELIASGILGAVSDFTAQVIGDVVAFSKTEVGFVDSRVHSASALSLRGVHGSMTAQEMYIPLITEVC